MFNKKTRLTAEAIFSDIMLANLINEDDILIVTFIWTIQWLNITCICCLGSSTIQVKTLLHCTVLFLIGGATDFSPATIVCEQGKFRKNSWLTRSTGCAVFLAVIFVSPVLPSTENFNESNVYTTYLCIVSPGIEPGYIIFPSHKNNV